VEDGAGSYLPYSLEFTALNSAIISSVKKTLTKSEREAVSLPTDSKAGQALIGHLLGDG
jgi:hypothetical protein